MSKFFFNANNKVGEIWSFQTNSSSADTFSVTTDGKSVLWDKGDGSSYIRGTSGLPSFSYTDSGTTKTVSIRTSKGGISEIEVFSASGKKLVGHLDMSGWDSLGGPSLFADEFNVGNNPELTAITHTSSNYNISQYKVNQCDIQGNLDVSMLNFDSTFWANQNSNLTSITHSNLNSGVAFYYAYFCDLQGNLDMTSFPDLGGAFRVYSNPNLTGITHTASTSNFNSYQAFSCDLTGELDLSMLSGIGGDFRVDSNSNLTALTFAPSSNSFTGFRINSCDITGHLDLSMLSGMGGSLNLYSNTNLTALTFGYSTENINQVTCFATNIIGSLDLTVFPNLGGQFFFSSNSNLTGITHTASTRTFTRYVVSANDLTGNHDVSMLENLGGELTFGNNDNLTGVTLPTGSSEDVRIFTINQCDIQGIVDISDFPGFGSSSSGISSTFRCHNNSGVTDVIFASGAGKYIRNSQNNSLNGAFGMFECGLGYVDFTPLSGITLLSGSTFGIPRFDLYNNSMTTAEVNHILSDFDTISTLNYSGWTATSGTTGGYIDISSNSAPDGSSGGYDGTGATVNLVSKGWTVITD